MVEGQEITPFEIILIAMLGMFILALGVVFFFLAYQRRLHKQQKDHQKKEADCQY